MKKIALLLAFCGIAFIGSAQVTVANTTLIPIFVGVQYTSPMSCTPEVSTGGDWILPGDVLLFTPPFGMEVLRVGVMTGTYGMGYVYPPCGPCTAFDMPGLYNYSWGGPGCAYVKIGV